MTTNVDGQFEKAGFDRERLFEIQGNYGEFQCSVPCHQEVYSNEEAIKKMVKASQNLKIPSEFIPHCPLNIEDKPKKGIITINQDIKEVLAAWKE